MWSTRSNRIMEIVVIVIGGAIISILNTLWLRSSLLQGIERIAKTNEVNILEHSKVTDIATKQRQHKQTEYEI